MGSFNVRSKWKKIIRKAFWIVILVGAYIWMVQTEKEAYVLAKAKGLYNSVVHWFDDVEVDYQIHTTKEKKETKSHKKRVARSWF